MLNELVKQNHLSVHYRYNHAATFPVYTELPLVHHSHLFTDMQIWGMAMCYCHQSNETSDWHRTFAHAIASELKDMASYNVLSKTDTYNGNTWSINVGTIYTMAPPSKNEIQ